MRTPYQASAINRVLKHFGLAQLTEAAALFDQMAYAVRDHDDFRRLVDKCEPEQRAEMYRSLAPRLSFEAKPLDVYVAELAIEAERKQLPTVGSDGKFKEFRVQEVNSDEYIATRAVRAAIEAEKAKHHLRLECVKCTREAYFDGARKVDAIFKARQAGWTYNEINGTGREICPKCPSGKKLD